MLQRVVRAVGQATAPVVVVAAAGQAIPPLSAAVELTLDAEECRGPLQGFAAGLAALSGRVEAVYLSSCDVPLLKPAFINRLFALLEDGDIAVPEAKGFRHPLAAVYRTAVYPVVQELLDASEGRLQLLFDRFRTRFVQADELADVDPTLASLRDVNTPEEYKTALKELEIV